MVKGLHLTEDPNEDAFSGVVSLDDVRAVLFMFNNDDLDIYLQMQENHIFMGIQKRKVVQFQVLHLVKNPRVEYLL